MKRAALCNLVQFSSVPLTIRDVSIIISFLLDLGGKYGERKEKSKDGKTGRRAWDEEGQMDIVSSDAGYVRRIQRGMQAARTKPRGRSNRFNI